MRVAAAVLVACGGAPPPSADRVAAPAPKTPASAPAITAEAACTRLQTLRAANCGYLDRLSINPSRCADMMGTMMKEAGNSIARCLVTRDACDDVLACIAEPTPTPTPTPTRVEDCAHHRPNARVAVASPRDNPTRLAGGLSSKAVPLEVCGFDAEMKLVESLTCGDDTRPVAGGMAVEKARVGDVGTGGRCNSVIDLYRITCPDRAYDVYVDAYVCPKW